MSNTREGNDVTRSLSSAGVDGFDLVRRRLESKPTVSTARELENVASAKYDVRPQRAEGLFGYVASTSLVAAALKNSGHQTVKTVLDRLDPRRLSPAPFTGFSAALVRAKLAFPALRADTSALARLA